MRATNLYFLSRNIDYDLTSVYEKNLSHRQDAQRTRYEELIQIRDIAQRLLEAGADRSVLDDFVYSFTLPGIGKEFDLLKIGENKVTVNVELKSHPIPEERIEKQLLQNRYYLSTVADTVHSFTFVRLNEKESVLYHLNQGLERCSFDVLLEKLSEVINPKRDEIERLFRSRDYLISPVNTPKLFLEGKYYLNNQQDTIKREIMSKIDSKGGCFGICGSAGTGKTLLVYDLAKSLAGEEKTKAREEGEKKPKGVCVVHCTGLSEGHYYLDRHLENVDFVSIKNFGPKVLRKYRYICVDEFQRMDEFKRNLLLEAYAAGDISRVILAYDKEQEILASEIKNDNPSKLAGLTEFREFKLTDKIRSNKELYAFIRNLMKLTDRPRTRIEYPDVDLVFANNEEEAEFIIGTYLKKNYTPLGYYDGEISIDGEDRFRNFLKPGQVIGAEYDNVLVVMDERFFYNEEGELESLAHPDPEYSFARLFFQNVARVREKLCIVVLANRDLFRKILAIKEEEAGNCL